MARKFCSVKVLYTSLALDHYLRTFSFDVLKQLCSCHVLKVFVIAYVASKLGALIHCMLLELPHCFPDDHSVSLFLVALVREFTEVNAVGKHLVNVLQEVSSGVAACA